MAASKVTASFRGTPGLYVHVPFCRTTCPFCPYNKVRYEPRAVAPYFAAVAAELSAYREHLPDAFTSLYVGGGTPTLCLDALAPALADVPVRGERAIEVLPSHAEAATLDRLVDLGFSHVSLGIQSFDDAVLRHLGRPHDGARGREALARTRGRFPCVDVDLIFDTAFADVATFLRDVESCLAAGVEQISAYPLMRFGMTPFGKADHDVPTEHEALARAAELAARYGYRRDAVWTFRREGAPAYSSITRPGYLGVGAGAATFTGTRFHVNHFHPERYATELGEGRLPIARTLRLGPAHAAAYTLFWSLYTGRVAVRPALPLPGLRAATSLLRFGTLTGHLRVENGSLRLTRRGYDRYHDLERWVTYRYIEPLWETLSREAAAASQDREPEDALRC